MPMARMVKFAVVFRRAFNSCGWAMILGGSATGRKTQKVLLAMMHETPQFPIALILTDSKVCWIGSLFTSIVADHTAVTPFIGLLRTGDG